MKPKFQQPQGSAELPIYNNCYGPECPCFGCHDDCQVCWAGPMCDLDDDSPCIRRAMQEEKHKGGIDSKMEERKFVDLLIVKYGAKLYVAEAPSSDARVGDLVEFNGVIGNVINNQMFCEVGDERYKWVSEIYHIYKVTQIWRSCYDH